MKLSLLDIVQEILNDLDSDPVNSIDDTVESQQVATIVKSCYNEIISNRNWPHLKKLVQLEASGQLDKPNYLVLPEGTKELRSFKYDKRKLGETKKRYEDVKYKDPESFLRFVANRNSDADNVETIQDFSGTYLLILNDQAPTFWTSFDDTYVVTDSYNSDIDSTLQKNKTQCIAYIEPKWVHEDDAIPNLPEEAFAALIEEAKSTAFLNLKQMANQKAEQKSNRQQRWLARKAWKANGGIQYDDYGRKGKRKW